MAHSSAANIVVIGSLNLDLTASVAHLPQAGETVTATTLTKRFGGKGGNQALAAARQGAQVMFIGNLGDDPEGRDYRNHLRREGINCSSLSTVRGMTGSAFISVDDQGENQIVVIPGANGSLTSPSIKMQRARIAVAKTLLLQLEIPLEATLEAIRLANDAQVPVLLNAAPLHPQFPWGSVQIEVLIVNELEARALLQLPAKADLLSQTDRSQDLQRCGIHHLIVTRGASSTLHFHGAGSQEVATYPVTPLDTVGAGDCFAGVFATHYAEGKDLTDCIHWANTAAALSTLKLGAQEGIPYRGDVQSTLLKTG